MTKFYNTQNPYVKYKKTYNYRMVTTGGLSNKVGSYFWTLGTYASGIDANDFNLDDQKNFAATGRWPLYHPYSGTYYSDMAWARLNFWQAFTNQVGGPGLLNRNDMIFRFRNNMNIRAFMTITYFIPRKGINLNVSNKNGKEYLEGLLVQSGTGLSPSSDWRNVPNATALFKMVVKKYTLAPGQTKAVKFKCGGLPFIGNNNRIDESFYNARFTRFMHIKCYGDMVFGQTSEFQNAPVLDQNAVGTGPCNIGYTVTHRIEGKKIGTPNNYIIDDLTGNANTGTIPAISYNTTTGEQIAGPKTLPIGGDQTQFITPNTSGWAQ